MGFFGLVWFVFFLCFVFLAQFLLNNLYWINYFVNFRKIKFYSSAIIFFMVASRFFYHQNFQHSNYITTNKTILFKLWSFSWRNSTDSWYWVWYLLPHQFGNIWIRWTKGIWKSKCLLYLLNFLYLC